VKLLKTFILQAAVILLLLITASLNMAYGQFLDGEESEGVQYGFVPVLGFSSDLGFIGGGLIQRFDYGDGVRPFLYSSRLDASISTMGFYTVNLVHEQTVTFKRKIRTLISIEAARYRDDAFFGIGNLNTFNSEQWEDGFFLFESKSIEAFTEFRIPILVHENGAEIDLLLGVLYKGRINIETDADTYFSNNPFDTSDGWITSLITGLVLDNRNSEFDPRRGQRLEFRLEGSPVASGDYSFAKASLNIRNYFPLHRNITFAKQFHLEHTMGNAPFWYLPTLGNQLFLRGFAANRFIGESMWSQSTEIRSWLFTLPIFETRIGAQVFWDSGRVFTEGDKLTDVLSGVRHTFGAGGVASPFSPDFILRGDVGLSNELWRVYVSLGYAF
jgi:hypothetical protein